MLVSHGYLALKLVHVLLAIVGVGFTSSFGVILALAAPKPAVMPHALAICRHLERVAAPCFFGLFFTGLALGRLGNVPLSTPWFAGSIALQLVAAALATVVLRPTMARQLALFTEPTPPTKEEVRRLGARQRFAGLVMTAISVTLVALMVFKPT